MSPRREGTVSRRTRETSVEARLSLEPGPVSVDSGIGFLDHMIGSLAFHAGFSLTLRCTGDLGVDDHHSAEDCGLALGLALSRALGDCRGIARFGWALAPMDEALARAAVDLSGRPFSRVRLGLSRSRLGALSCENLSHFLSSFATAASICLHLDLLRGDTDHHRAEAAFKALALALRQAVAPDGGPAGQTVPSAKGSLGLEGLAP